jgi:hypothetical protein
MRTWIVWVAMFLLGAVTAAGVGWMILWQPQEASASSPDRLGDNQAITGNVAQGVNGFYLVARDRTTWYLNAVAVNPNAATMAPVPRRNLARDITDATKELKLPPPRSLDFMMTTGQYSPTLDLVYLYEANSRILIVYYLKDNEITRRSFMQIPDK